MGLSLSVEKGCNALVTLVRWLLNSVAMQHSPNQNRGYSREMFNLIRFVVVCIGQAGAHAAVPLAILFSEGHPFQSGWSSWMVEQRGGFRGGCDRFDFFFCADHAAKCIHRVRRRDDLAFEPGSHTIVRMVGIALERKHAPDEYDRVCAAQVSAATGQFQPKPADRFGKSMIVRSTRCSPAKSGCNQKPVLGVALGTGGYQRAFALTVSPDCHGQFINGLCARKSWLTLKRQGKVSCLPNHIVVFPLAALKALQDEGFDFAG